MSFSTTSQLQLCLIRLGKNDASARSELLSYAQRRLGDLADRMFHRFPALRYREQSDDLFQEAMLRLWKSLEAVGPTTIAEFMGLAALQMRRALCDFARNHARGDFSSGSTLLMSSQDFREAGAKITSPVEDAANSPEELACWSEFHNAVDQLSALHRTTFDLLFYHELSQQETAEIMNVSVRQIQRYWNSARLELADRMHGAWPEL